MKIKKKHIIICSVAILFLISSVIIYILCHYNFAKIDYYISPYAIKYEFNKNNLLGLKRIFKDGKKYIYELSSNKYLTKAKVKRINNSEYTSIIGIYYDRDSGEYIEKTISNAELFNSGNSTYIIVNIDSDYEYTGIHLYYDNDKRISIRYDNEAIVSKANLDYDRNIIKQISQKYTNNKWGKPSKYAAPINPYR